MKIFFNLKINYVYTKTKKVYIYRSYTKVIQKRLMDFNFFSSKEKVFLSTFKTNLFPHFVFSNKVFFVLIVYKYMSLNVTHMSNLVHDNSELKTPAN